MLEIAEDDKDIMNEMGASVREKWITYVAEEHCMVSARLQAWRCSDQEALMARCRVLRWRQYCNQNTEQAFWCTRGGSWKRKAMRMKPPKETTVAESRLRKGVEASEKSAL